MSSLTQILLGPVCYGAPIGKDFDSTEIKKILPHVPPPSTPHSYSDLSLEHFQGYQDFLFTSYHIPCITFLVTNIPLAKGFISL